jgi:hypothetical protein
MVSVPTMCPHCSETLAVVTECPAPGEHSVMQLGPGLVFVGCPRLRPFENLIVGPLDQALAGVR